MTIISAKQKRNGTYHQVSPKQIKKDYPLLLKKHQQALKSEPTWSFFGGTIVINNRVYQVS